jgi:2-aminoadipate transaminase
MAETFDFEKLFVDGLPAAAAKWDGFPKYNFVGGHNDPDAIPIDGLIAAAERVLRRRGQTLATYGQDSGPLGDRELRAFLADRLVRYRGLSVTSDDVLVTSGSGQALELINDVLLKPGDIVVAEEFTYQGALNRLRGRGIQVVGAPLDEGGLNIAGLAAVLKALDDRGIEPKFVYTIPTVQNPTSTVLDVARREQLLALTREHGVAVVEDECYADLLWDSEWPKSMYGMEGAEHVIHVGSFSKYLAPALRLGYAVAPWPLLSQMTGCKSVSTGALEQMVVAEFLSAHYAEHVEDMKVRLRDKRDVLVAALEEHFGTAAEFTVPPGGIYLWLKLPSEVDTLKLSEAALKEGVAFNAGPIGRSMARRQGIICACVSPTPPRPRSATASPNWPRFVIARPAFQSGAPISGAPRHEYLGQQLTGDDAAEDEPRIQAVGLELGQAVPGVVGVHRRRLPDQLRRSQGKGQVERPGEGGEKAGQGRQRHGGAIEGEQPGPRRVA